MVGTYELGGGLVSVLLKWGSTVAVAVVDVVAAAGLAGPVL